jgi:Uncharacterised nucleotidyltransferase
VVTEAIERGADMEWAATEAVEHRISALLWRALAAAEALDALGAARQSLGALTDVYRMEAMLLLPKAVDLAVRPLTAAGLEPVVLKGPLLAARYPEPGLRPMEDIDLLLPPAQHQGALTALADAGWMVTRPARRDVYDTMLSHPDVPALSLELHYGLEHAPQRVTTLDAETLWSRRRPADCLGTAAFGLPFPEEIVFLGAHAGKPHHGFFRLIWIADLAMITGLEPDSGAAIDWAQVHSVAQAGSCTTVVAAALALARRAGVDSPSQMFPLPRHGWRGSAVRQLTDEAWPLAHLDLPGYHLNYALADDRRLRLRILFVLLGSGYGIGRRLRGAVDALVRLWTRARRSVSRSR